ncbi:MAG: VOC family protein [Planctomycetes bacterium]|nr:VOC family protein [Planctomycetota bacterium]
MPPTAAAVQRRRENRAAGREVATRRAIRDNTTMLEKLCPILPSRDIADTERFWQRLGFETVYRDDAAYLLMKRDGAEVHFFHHPGLDPAANDHGAYLRPADIRALSAEWAALGLPAAHIPRFEPVADKPWGMAELALVDVDGNLIRAGQELPLDG